jgi:predicted transporter
MEKAFARAEELAGHVKEYVNNRLRSVKLSAAEKISKVAANLIALTITMVIMLFFTVFASIALAFVLAEWTGKLYWGFLIVAGLYLLLAAIIWVAKERLLQLPIMNSLLQQFYSEEEEEENEED